MPHTKPAFEFLESKIPELKSRAGDPRSLLYVGWRCDSSRWWYDVFAKKLISRNVGVLDIFEPNLIDFDGECWAGAFHATRHHGDVRMIDNLFVPGLWDVIFWDHGPEHVSREDLQLVTPKLFKAAGRLLVYACPWGLWPQGEEDGNPNEIHANSVEPEELTRHGMEVKTFGGSGQQNEGEIVAFKVTHEQKEAP